MLQEAFERGRASRDAEVEALRALAKLQHETNQGLMAEVEALRAALEIDYVALVAACYERTKQPQGTRGCVQFKLGAEWLRERVQAALAARGATPQPAEPVMPVRAKPIEWEQDDDKQWSEKNPVRWGFTIQLDDDETPAVYRAYWGENDGETCESLEEAKGWCQKTADDFVADAVLSIGAGQPSPQPAEQPMTSCPHGVPHRWPCETCDNEDGG